MRGLEYAHVQAALPQTEVDAVGPYMLQLMLRNVATDGFTFVDPTTAGDRAPRRSRPGCILASPSYPAILVRTDQDYVYHWTRDGAIAAVEMATNPMFLTPVGVCQQLCDYVAFSRLCQASAIAAGHFYRAAYQIDGTVRDWSDQQDGPALQNLALVAALPRLDAASQATARAIAQENLDRIVQDWDSDQADFFNPWEEVMGASFFARAAELRCLQEIQSSNELDLVEPPGLGSAVTKLTDALADHWDPTHGWYVSVQNGTLPADSLLSDLSGYDPNADIIMACIYGAVACTDPKLLATAAQLRAQFDVGGSSAYAINTADRNLSAGRVGPLIGRYAADIYDGDVGRDRSQPTRGHPWAICTGNFAELYYRLAASFSAGRSVTYDANTGTFFDQIGLDEATVNNSAQSSDVTKKLISAGDIMMQALIYHSDHFELSEQFDAQSGYEKSVTNLTWSYAAYLSAARARP
jgi:glucoamylase